MAPAPGRRPSSIGKTRSKFADDEAGAVPHRREAAGELGVGQADVHPHDHELGLFRGHGTVTRGDEHFLEPRGAHGEEEDALAKRREVVGHEVGRAHRFVLSRLEPKFSEPLRHRAAGEAAVVGEEEKLRPAPETVHHVDGVRRRLLPAVERPVEVEHQLGVAQHRTSAPCRRQAASSLGHPARPSRRTERRSRVRRRGTRARPSRPAPSSGVRRRARSPGGSRGATRRGDAPSP